MRCKVIAVLLFYNNRTYSKGEYVEVADNKVNMFIREHLAEPCPVKPKHKAPVMPKGVSDMRNNGHKNVKRGK
jgi:(2Fe-2S) ferredoxin